MSDKIERVQRALVDLLAPLADDRDFLGLKLVFTLHIDGDIWVAAITSPDIFPRAEQMINRYMARMAAGETDVAGTYIPAPTVKN